MLQFLLLTTYSLLFGGLAYKNFRLAVGLFIIALPSYLIRFDIVTVGRYAVPSTLLELSLGILLVVWLLKYFKTDWSLIKQTVAGHKFLFASALVFFLSSIASIFVSDMWWFSLGQWRAYILEPLLFFFILIGRQKQISPKDLIIFLALSTLSISLLSIIQKLTGQFFPPSLWNDELFGRVTSFFTTPNAVGLYLVPILLISLPLLWQKDKSLPVYCLLFTVYSINLFAVVLARSAGACIALAAGLLVFVFLIGYKKIVFVAVILGVMGAMLAPQLRQAITFQDQAGQNRLLLWSYTTSYLVKSPKNFILGPGIRQFFRKIQKPYYEAKKLERLVYAHNIFLNFWTETGLFGMLGIIGVIGYSLHLTFYYLKKNRLLGAGIIAAIVAIIIHGLVDVPYFKNDLAIIFWVVISISLSSNNPKQ